MNELKYKKKIAPEILSCISGRELLIQHIGQWPTFHDFEVLSLNLERPLVISSSRDLRATFFVFDLDKAPSDPNRKQGTAEFLFEGIDDLKIDGFNHQNPILGISITSAEPSVGASPFLVEWGGTFMKHDVSFKCNRISILRVIDLNPFRKVIPLFG